MQNAKEYIKELERSGAVFHRVEHVSNKAATMFNPGEDLQHLVKTATEQMTRHDASDVAFYDDEKPELIQITAISDRVVIARQEAPHYLAGIKPSGRAVWTHSMKLAVAFDTPSLKLGEVLDRMEHYQIDVLAMPACWFSNHQP
jgi:hypothetical protein